MSYQQTNPAVSYHFPQISHNALAHFYPDKEAVDLLKERQAHEAKGANCKFLQKVLTAVPAVISFALLGAAALEYKNEGFGFGVGANLAAAVGSLAIGFGLGRLYKRSAELADENADAVDELLFVKNNGKSIVEAVNKDGIREEFKANYRPATLAWAKQFEVKPPGNG